MVHGSDGWHLHIEQARFGCADGVAGGGGVSANL